MNNILVIAPHADDEVLGCGGTIKKLSDEGAKVIVLIMTNASVGAPELFSEQSIAIVRKEARQAHEILGVHKSIFLDLPAPQLEQYPSYKVAQAISRVVSEYKIDMMYVPHKGDLHLDHGVVYNAALVAGRPFPEQTVTEILAYETLSETEWGHPTCDNVFTPVIFQEITENQFQAKLDAMKAFASQLKSFPNTRSLETIEHQASYRGSCVGVHRAEAYMLIRSKR